MTREEYASRIAGAASYRVMQHNMTSGRVLGPGVKPGAQQRVEDRAYESAYAKALDAWDAADDASRAELVAAAPQYGPGYPG